MVERAATWTVHAGLLLVVVFWGLAFVAIKQALAHMSWITLTFLRFAVADACYLAYLGFAVRPRPPVPRADVPRFLLLGLLGFTAYHAFLNLGESDPSTTAGTAALIIASAPAFIAVFAALLLRERLATPRVTGLALAFAGLAVMVLLAQPGSELRFAASWGALAVLPPAAFTALYFVLGKGLLARFPPFVFVAYTILFGTLLAVPLVLASWPEFLRDLAGMGWDGAVPVLYLGIAPTFVAYGLWFRALDRMPAARVGSYVYLSTLVAVLGGVVVLGEAVTLPGVAGGAMVIAGVAIAQHAGRAAPRSAPKGFNSPPR